MQLHHAFFSNLNLMKMKPINLPKIINQCSFHTNIDNPFEGLLIGIDENIIVKICCENLKSPHVFFNNWHAIFKIKIIY